MEARDPAASMLDPSRGANFIVDPMCPRLERAVLFFFFFFLQDIGSLFERIWSTLAN